jgi:FkbM family methyltransferase
MSYSQHKQDLFVIETLKGKKNGYFVEFGATNGKSISNTYLLEKEYGWNGIVAEPCKYWHEELQKNRTCNISLKCVWSASNETLLFNEPQNKDLSCIDAYSANDMWAADRMAGQRYFVQTISLMDLLAEFKAPEKIDYLSIDTEGSELRILSAFDFDKYKIKIITCEHNNTHMQQPIIELLVSKGYRLVTEGMPSNEDWFILDTKRKS